MTTTMSEDTMKTAKVMIKFFNCNGLGYYATMCLPSDRREIEYDKEEEGNDDTESVSEDWIHFVLQERRR